MTLNQHLLNYPTPIIAIDENGFVAAKNYLMEMTLPVVKVGACVRKYSDISFTVEQLSRGAFCDRDCTYFTLFDTIDGVAVTLLFLSFASFGETLLPFDIFEIYKERIAQLTSLEPLNKNKERQYIRSVHNNLLRVKYFNALTAFFQKTVTRTKMIEEVSLPKLLTSVNTVVQAHIDNLSFEIPVFTTITQIDEIDAINLIFNSLLFSVINSTKNVVVRLRDENEFSILTFSFETNATFDSWLNKEDNAVLNSSLSLITAFELAKINNIKYTLKKQPDKKTVKYTLEYIIPSKRSRLTRFSSGSDLTKLKILFKAIFFNE